MDIYEEFRTLCVLIDLEDDILERLDLIQKRIEVEDKIGVHIGRELN